MKRVPEPELMEAEDQARAYAEADFEEPNSAFVDRFDALFPDALAEARAIDLGCGPADITIRMALRHPGWRFEAVDGSAAMLVLARMAVQAARLRKQVQLVCGRLPHLPLLDGEYDVIVSNSLLHHLPTPEILWDSVAKLAKPGCRVLVMDLMRPPSERHAERIVEQYSADEPEVLRRDFLLSLCAAWRPDEVRAQLDAAGLTELQVEPSSDRHMIIWGTVGG